MNYFKAVGAILAIAFAGLSNAQHYQFVGTDQSMETKLCVNAGNNDAKELRATLRKMGVRVKRKSINNVLCNDVSPAKFAFKYGALETFEYLNKRSYGKAKVKPSVTISDVVKAKSAKPVMVYVTSAN